MRRSPVEVAGVSEVTHAGEPRRSAQPESVAEQIRRKGIKPLRSANDLRADVWESDEELQEFLDHLYESRRSGLG
jgi:hypothetical protein